jgi:PDZ domain-containing protein
MLGRNLWLTVCGLLLLSHAARCEETAAGSPGPGSSAQELRGWVQQLNADDYNLREEAAGKLTAAGPAAIEALIEGMTSDQAEVAWRCGAALDQIGLEGDEKTIDKIVQHLDAAASKSGKKLNSLARDLRARQKQFRRERAVAQIRKQGGQIAGVGIDGGIEEMAVAPMVGPVMVFDGPAIALAEPIAEFEAPADPEPPAAVEIIGDVARAIGRLLVPEAARIERPIAAAPPIPLPPALPPAEVTPAEDKPAEEKPAADKPAEEKPAEDKPAEASVPPEVEGGAPAADVAVAEVAFAEAMIAVDLGGPGGMAVEGGWAQLALDQNWRGGDEGLSVLADVPDVTQIDIRGARLTDKALEHLARLPRLGMLNIHKSPFTRNALLKFHRGRPSVQVYARGEAMLGVNADFGSSPLLLASVFDGSGAADAGLQVGDIIHQIDGVKIRDFSELTICISTKKPGEQIEVVYERGGNKQTVAIKLTRRTIDD